MALRIVTDLKGNVFPSDITISVDHYESRMVISVVGMREITESEIRDLIQTKYKVAAIHTDSVFIRGKPTGGLSRIAP